MNLRLNNLRDVLCNILFGDDSMKKYIVPLQGNWYNPTTEKESKNTWVGYVIDYTDFGVNAVNLGTAIQRTGRSQVHLTFIGPAAEEMANSVVFWPYRADVVSEFKKYPGVLDNKAMRVFTSLYMQEGAASTLCYNVNLTVSYNETMEISSAILRKVELQGDLIIS